VDRVKLRYRSRPLPARVAGTPPAGAHGRLELELGEPVDGAAPGQTACLMAGDRDRGPRHDRAVTRSRLGLRLPTP